MEKRPDRKWRMQRGRRVPPLATGWRRRIGLREKLLSSARQNCLRTVICLVAIQLVAVAGNLLEVPRWLPEGGLLLGVMIEGAILVFLTLAAIFGFKTMRRSESWRERTAYLGVWLLTLGLTPLLAAARGDL